MTAGVKKRVAHKSKEIESTKHNAAEQESKFWDPMQEGVKWIEKYAEPLEKIYQKLPECIGTLCASLAIFTFGATLRGEWIFILVAGMKQYTGQNTSDRNMTMAEFMSLFTERNLKMENFSFIFVAAHTVSYCLYFLFGGFLHWYYYMRKRESAAEWKIQPNKWMTPELERHEIMLGASSLLFTNSFSAFLATYIYNGNPSCVYYQFDDYGWLWFFLQFPVLFILIDYVTYVLHCMYHTRWLYKYFHKMHHKYKQPTAFSVTAMHPVELLHFQMTLCSPLFLFPCHWLPFSTIVIYNYYHGIIDHSGINFKAQWWQPWQPDAEFHDQHHEFFHVNFGFNMFIWDKLHGTMRKPNRVYTENTFHGEAPLLGTTEGKAAIEAEAASDDQTLPKES